MSGAAEKLRALLEPYDCGDSSCLFAREKTGMRTNGGCRCLGRGNAKPGLVPRVAKVYGAGHALADALNALADFPDTCEIHSDGVCWAHARHSPCHDERRRKVLAAVEREL